MNVEAKKQVLRKITYGMWVLAANAGEDVEASSVTWVTQASFEPPLIAVCLRADTHLCSVVAHAKAFSLHLVSATQRELAQAFIKPTRVDRGKIGGLAWKRGVTGAPLLDGFGAWLEARITDTVARGDHTLFVAEVVEAAITDAEVAPLALAATGWTYGG